MWTSLLKNSTIRQKEKKKKPEELHLLLKADFPFMIVAVGTWGCVTVVSILTSPKIYHFHFVFTKL